MFLSEYSHYSFTDSSPKEGNYILLNNFKIINKQNFVRWGDKLEVKTIFSNGKTISLSGQGDIGQNKLDVLTGPNGAGKTAALTSLVRAFVDVPKRRSLSTFRNFKEVDAFPDVLGMPSRILAQTFSPFTRFPMQPQTDERLLDVYSDDLIKKEPYICLGLHKSFRGMSGQISRRILEEALIRTSEFPESTKSLFEVMKSIGFSPMLRLIYRPRQNMLELFNELDLKIVINYLESQLEYRRISTSLRSKVRRELETKNIGELANTILAAVEAVRLLCSNEKSVDPYRHHQDALILPLQLESIRRNFYALQAVSLLRYFEIINLTHCEIMRTKDKIPFDIANASSGEQQMLCSIFGIASAIRDESLVLIDEPELSLHPKRQIDFVEAIRALLELVKGCHVIVSTHSPVVVQAAKAIGAGIIQLGESDSVSLSSRGSAPISVEQALVDVFETPVPGSAHVSNQIFKAIVSAETGGKPGKKAAREKLLTLGAVYGPTNDAKTYLLIRDALRLVESSGRTSKE